MLDEKRSKTIIGKEETAFFGLLKYHVENVTITSLKTAVPKNEIKVDTYTNIRFGVSSKLHKYFNTARSLYLPDEAKAYYSIPNEFLISEPKTGGEITMKLLNAANDIISKMHNPSIGKINEHCEEAYVSCACIIYAIGALAKISRYYDFSVDTDTVYSCDVKQYNIPMMAGYGLRYVDIPNICGILDKAAYDLRANYNVKQFARKLTEVMKSYLNRFLTVDFSRKLNKDALHVYRIGNEFIAAVNDPDEEYFQIIDFTAEKSYNKYNHTDDYLNVKIDNVLTLSRDTWLYDQFIYHIYLHYLPSDYDHSDTGYDILAYAIACVYKPAIDFAMGKVDHAINELNMSVFSHKKFMRKQFGFFKLNDDNNVMGDAFYHIIMAVKDELWFIAVPQLNVTLKIAKKSIATIQLKPKGGN